MCAPRANETGSPGRANLCEAMATHLECVLCNVTLRRVARWKCSRLGLHLSYRSNACLLTWGWAPPRYQGCCFFLGWISKMPFLLLLSRSHSMLGSFSQWCLSGKALNLAFSQTDQYIWEISCSSDRNFISGMFTNTEFWSNTWS